MALLETDIDELVAAWREYCDGIGDWHELVAGAAFTQTGNGTIYELPSPLAKDRPHESMAICDMTGLRISEAHYHPANNWEFYFVLSGNATVVVGTHEHHVKTGDSVVIPPDTAHFTLPGPDFVIAAVNNPPFTPQTYITLGACDESRLEVEFDLGQYQRLSAQAGAASAA
jgi:mannose-6-phosphate isomerase-like protein (cupin superfamily)